MQKDLRERNEYFSTKNISKYLGEYADVAARAVKKIDKQSLQDAQSFLQCASRVFVAGNGGSSSISDHLCCDLEKGAGITTNSLVGKPALLSAIANDIGYEDVFEFQLRAQDLEPGDVVVLISSSGNSPNIVKAAKFAISRGAWVIGLTGFDGGILKKIARVSLHVDVNNYGVIEDCHQTLMHVLAQFIYLDKRDAK